MQWPQTCNYITYRNWLLLISETSMCGSPEKTSGEVKKKKNNSRYLYRQLHRVEKELGLLGPSRFPRPDRYNRAMQQVQGMKGLLEYHLPSPSLERAQLDINTSPEENVNADSSNKCCQGGLPWWFIFIGWILVIATSGVSGYFTMMYGLTYGKEQSINWLISMVVSFFESLFITQPLKASKFNTDWNTPACRLMYSTLNISHDRFLDLLHSLLLF